MTSKEEEERDLYYLKSIQAQLQQVKSAAAFSRFRSMLGLQVLADNIDWLDDHISKRENGRI